MNKLIYKLHGTIICRQLRKVSPQSKYAGQAFYRLTIAHPDWPRRAIQVFKDKLINPTIWETLEHREYLRTPYTFFCHNHQGYYYLVDWEEEWPEVDHEQPKEEGGE